MDRTIAAKLQELGLSEKEASLYLTLLSLGSRSVQDIARSARLERSTTYLLLGSLANKGFVTMTGTEPAQYAAQDPSELTRMANEAVVEAENVYAAVRKTAEKLAKVVAESSHAPRASYFDTSEGLLTLHNEVKRLSAREPGFALLHSERSLELMKGGVLDRIVLVTDNENEHAVAEKEVRLVTKEQYPINSDLFLFPEKLILISEDEEFGVRIESKDFAEIMRQAFNLAWEEAGRLDTTIRGQIQKSRARKGAKPRT